MQNQEEKKTLLFQKNAGFNLSAYAFFFELELLLELIFLVGFEEEFEVFSLFLEGPSINSVSNGSQRNVVNPEQVDNISPVLLNLLILKVYIDNLTH